MGIVILEPIEDLAVFSTLSNRVKAQVKSQVNKYGVALARERLEKTLDNTGNVSDITRSILFIVGMIFDRNRTDVLSSTGIMKVANAAGGVPRCFVAYDTDIVEGDYVLVNYNQNADTWDEKYKVVEKEAHDLNNDVMFYTLYLQQVTS